MNSTLNSETSLRTWNTLTLTKNTSITARDPKYNLIRTYLRTYFMTREKRRRAGGLYIRSLITFKDLCFTRGGKKSLFHAYFRSTNSQLFLATRNNLVFSISHRYHQRQRHGQSDHHRATLQ